ncbi:MAG TPA: AsmA family protein, partial [Burkholderiales bacterium]|nr:AsmA family protein [Burkholderiales bacterium]
MRYLKITLVAVAALLVIAIGAGAYLISRIDEEALVREARSAVKNATGRALDIEGKVDLRISFNPAIVAEGVRFSNASWGSRPEMARVQRLEVELDLIPLLRGTVRIDRLVLIRPDVLLETDAKGRANWEFGARDAAGVPGKSSDSGTGLAIEAGALRIREGVLAYRDGKMGSTTRVELSALDFQEAAFGKLQSVIIAGRVNGRAFKVKGALGRLHELLARDGTFPLDLEVTTDPARLSAQGKLIDVLGRADVQLQVKIEAAEVHDLGALLDRRIPALGPLKARARVEREKGRVGIRDLDLSLGRPGALHVSARGSIRDVLKPAGAALDFSASAPESKHAPAFRASGRLEDFKDGVRISGLKMASGANELTGALEYRAGKERPEIVARLEGSSLDLAFLAAAPGAPSGAAPASGGPIFTREPVPLARLRAIDADARISLGALVLPNRITLRNFTAQLELRGGRLRAAPVSFVAGGGEASAELVLDASG